MIKKGLILLLILGFGSIALAANSPSSPAIYQINLIAFKNQNPIFNSEIWPSSPVQPDFAKAVNFIPAKDTITPESYRLLPPEQSGLKMALQRLNNSSRYKVLASLSWQQPLTTASNAKLLHIFGGKAYTADGTILDLPAIQPPQEITSAKATVANNGIMPTNWELNGTLRVSRATFIEIDANFLLTEKVPVMNTDNGGTSTETKLISFPLKQHLRMRSGEIQYLDNPVYGILILVTPVK